MKTTKIEWTEKTWNKQWGTWGADGVKRSKYANGKLLKGRVRQGCRYMDARRMY
jgi:hypothetical protein